MGHCLAEDLETTREVAITSVRKEHEPRYEHKKIQWEFLYIQRKCLEREGPVPKGIGRRLNNRLNGFLLTTDGASW